MTRKAFTVEEANALIPSLEAVLARIDRCRTEMRQEYDKIQVLDALWGAKVTDSDNPDHAEFTAHRTAVEAAVESIGDMIEQEILGRGIRFPQGGLEHGLLDFPTTYEGRWVYLCWRVGEPQVKAWHEVDAGYAGRRPLTPEQARLMGNGDDPAQFDDWSLDF